ncbi:hypothetical protein TSUD_406970 [Trifolium subterraneum]|uniref:Reverse transcriptase zinc-binding domain-containing protein n=1 Tax=Trifolium subterraneum TaxID=3900 RepID=A0A2Z6PGJ8_TRISU|nr:hypothetical protein TSUD_406970 [Trifolium subterraneum]
MFRSLQEFRGCLLVISHSEDEDVQKLNYERLSEANHSKTNQTPRRISFPTLWRKWIKECVCTVTGSVLVNGSPTDAFSLERGLRQGDPLSPFLFLLAAEGLNVLMKALVANNLFTGYSVALRTVLVLFELMSGLIVNFNKSMLVGVNIPESCLNEVALVLHCNMGKIPFLYLGLPIGGESRRLSFWEPVLTRIENRFSVWVGEGLVGRQRGEGSSWWREIVKIRDGVGGVGSEWFRESVVKRVGNGAEHFFWTDPWLGGRPLGERFGRLFDLAENKSCSVAEMFSLGWEEGGEAWAWRRQLWAWEEEEMLRECQTLLLNFSFQVQTSDYWQWKPDLDSGYSVCGAYRYPLKVTICAWRLLRDRLPTKANLVPWGIIPSAALFCVSECGGIESTQHLFFTCGTFGTLWSAVRLWIGFSSMDHQNPSGHFIHFVGALGERRTRRSFMQLIWLACVWVIWNERNNRLFSNTTQTVPQLLDKVKWHSLWWLKTSNVTLGANLHS